MYKSTEILVPVKVVKWFDLCPFPPCPPFRLMFCPSISFQFIHVIWSVWTVDRLGLRDQLCASLNLLHQFYSVQSFL